MSLSTHNYLGFVWGTCRANIINAVRELKTMLHNVKSTSH